MSILNINANEYEEAIKEGFTIVDLYGDNCPWCVKLSDELDMLNSEVPFIKIVKVNTTHNPEISKQYKIMGVPTILFIKNGEVAERNTGFMNLEKLKEKAGQYMY